MTTQTYTQGARTALLTYSTLASATYLASSAIDLGATVPLDVIVESEHNANGAPSGNTQLMLFVKLSLDGTNYGSGPESGTTATEQADLHPLGVVPSVDTNDHRKFFSFREAGIPITRYFKLVVKNDMGVALASGAANYSVITGGSV